MDYLRYEELTSDSKATEEDVNNLTIEAKKGRGIVLRKEIGL
jgi:hypothetical protein